MNLKGARVALDAGGTARLDIGILSGRIQFGEVPGRSVDLRDHLILPGLINAHDHLEFNLFPRLGRGPHPNSAAWAREVYQPETSPVREQLQIPKPVRLFWGGVKNLVAGVTSVLHHNPYLASIFERDFPVRVIRNFGWAHSTCFSPDFGESYKTTPRSAPFVIHACEGTDAQARDEIYRLDSAGALGPSTLIVHGVALGSEEIALMERRGASLVWCPTSNEFTLGRTLSAGALRSRIPIALGTDSAITGVGDLIDEIEAARHYVSDDRVYRMVTSEAAAILRLTEGEGVIRASGVADLVVVRDRGQTPARALAELRPELVIAGGRVKLASAAVLDRLRSSGADNFHPVEIEGRGRWMLACNLPEFLEPVRRTLGPEVCLAGKRVTA